MKFIAKNFRQISNTIFVHKNSFLGLNFVQVHLTQMHLIRSNSSRLDIMDVGRRHYNDDSSFIKWCGIEKRGRASHALLVLALISQSFCEFISTKKMQPMQLLAKKRRFFFPLLCSCDDHLLFNFISMKKVPRAGKRCLIFQ